MKAQSYIIPKALSSLVVFVIYEHPNDYPEDIVVRKFRLNTATDDIKTFSSLFDARKELRMNGYSCMTRHQDDDPSVVETWL